MTASSKVPREKVTLLDDSDPVSLLHKPNPENPGPPSRLREVPLRNTHLRGSSIRLPKDHVRNQSLPHWASVWPRGTELRYTPELQGECEKSPNAIIQLPKLNPRELGLVLEVLSPAHSPGLPAGPLYTKCAQT